MENQNDSVNEEKNLGIPSSETKPTSELKAAPSALGDDVCHICGCKAWASRSGDGFLVNDCHRCERATCQNCAECDYDLQGDPGHYVCTQWVCSDRSKCLNDVDRAYIAERQAREIRALENPTHADYARIIFPEHNDPRCEYCGDEMDEENAGEPCLDCADQLKREEAEKQYWAEVNRTAWVTSPYNNGSR